MYRKKRSNDKTSGTIELEYINEKIVDCPDIIRKKVYIENKHEGYFLYIHGLTDNNLMQRDFISPVVTMKLDELTDENNIYNLASSTTDLLYDSKSVVDSIISGNSVFVCDALPFAISCSFPDFEKRGIEEPITEKNVRGPHEGFVEPLVTNLAILRRKTKNSNLKFKTVTLGTQTKQDIVIAFIDGVANKSIVNSLVKKISGISIDGLTAIGVLEQNIVSHPNSLFPQFVSTERPDKALAALLEGRIVVLQDGTPVTLIAPVDFFSFFQAPDDYNTLWIHGSFLRLIRVIAALFIAVMLPSLYIAITTFHYFAVPLSLLVPLAESRAKVPFPPIIEVLILEITVEMVREAAVRLPTYIGTAISVVAGLIIGEAAVQAGIVSDLLIVIVAATAVAAYVIPSYDMSLAIRILRFGFIIAASVFGMVGIVICTGLTLAHLVSMNSLGQPYLEPFAPFSPKDIKDTFLRLPINAFKTRPGITRSKNKIRSKNNDRK